MLGNLPPGVSATFASHCMTCGETTQVVDGHEQPHRCRIDLDAQRAGILAPPDGRGDE